MSRDHELVPVSGKPHDHETHERRARYVELDKLLLFQQLRHPLALIDLGVVDQIELTPRHGHRACDHLHQLTAAALAEGRPQAGVPVDQCLD